MIFITGALVASFTVHVPSHPLKDELLAELEGMEQEDLEKDLLEVPAGSSRLPDDTIGVDDLPSVRTHLS